MDKIDLSLHHGQLKKFALGKAIQLSHSQLMNGGGAINVDAEIPIHHIQQLAKNLKHGKGFRLNPKFVHGGSILKHAKDFAVSLLKKSGTKDLISHGLQAGAAAASTALTGNPTLGMAAAPLIDQIVHHDYKTHPPHQIVDQARSQLNDHVNQQIDMGIKHATGYAQQHLQQQLAPYYQGYAPMQSQYNSYSPYINNLPIDYGGTYYDPYKEKLMYGLGLKKHRKRSSKAKKEMKEESSSEEEEEPKRRGRKKHHKEEDGEGIKKGSEEALEWGKKMKALRKRKRSGGSIKSTFQNLGNQIKSAFTNKANQNAAISLGVGTAIDAATGTPIGTLATPLIDQGVTALRNQIGMGIDPHHHHFHRFMGMGLGLTPHRLGMRIQNPDGNIVGGTPPGPLMSHETLNKVVGLINTKKLGGSFAPPMGY